MAASPPRLPGDPHLVTLAYLIGILGLGALILYIVLQVRQLKQGQEGG